MARPLIAQLRQDLIDTYQPLIDASRPVALIDFPAAINSGDHAIWLGEKALLRHLGITAAYECAMETYDRQAMAGALKDGTILMHGGGNFGDVYKYHQFRLQVLADFPDNPVILFPQSMMFYSTKMLKETAELYERHGNATITARDALTHFKMSRYFGPRTKVLLAPDMAFMLDKLKRVHPPKFDILWLLRDDREASTVLPVEEIEKIAPLAATRLRITPFNDGEMLVSSARIAGETLCVTDWFKARFANKGGFQRYQAWNHDTQSLFWVTWALSILALGKVVVTDRLHGHILSTLAGIPNILLNNNYGKNFTYYDTWMKDAEVARIAPTPRQAIELALRVTRTMPTTEPA